MRIEGNEYRTIWFENNVVKIIDQTKLPHQFVIKELQTVNDAINALSFEIFFKSFSNFLSASVFVLINKKIININICLIYLKLYLQQFLIYL